MANTAIINTPWDGRGYIEVMGGGFRDAGRVLVDQECDAPMMPLYAECLGEDGDRSLRAREAERQWKNTEFR